MKGRLGPPFALSMIIGLLLMLVLVPIALNMIGSAGEASEGCSALSSILADMLEGGVQTC